MQHHLNDGRLQAGRALDRHIDRTWRFGFDPVTEAAQHAVGGDGRADAGSQIVERGITRRALDHSLNLGAMLIVVAQRRQRHLGLPRLAVTQDQQATGWHALGQHIAAQCGGGQHREPCEQRNEDGFTRSGHDSPLHLLKNCSTHYGEFDAESGLIERHQRRRMKKSNE